MSMWTCPGCGAPNTPARPTCYVCGTGLPVAAPGVPPPLIEELPPKDPARKQDASTWRTSGLGIATRLSALLSLILYPLGLGLLLLLGGLWAVLEATLMTFTASEPHVWTERKGALLVACISLARIALLLGIPLAALLVAVLRERRSTGVLAAAALAIGLGPIVIKVLNEGLRPTSAVALIVAVPQVLTCALLFFSWRRLRPGL